jgi:hypothetical protein
MDSQLVMSVLNDALEKHPHPEIFNTDQGQNYTLPQNLWQLFKISYIEHPKKPSLFLDLNMSTFSEVDGVTKRSHYIIFVCKLYFKNR